jgi:hypothetical protein
VGSARGSRYVARAMNESNNEKHDSDDGVPATPERRDAEGLPLDRDATLDDVRGGANHFKFAVGCSAVVALLLVAFWVLRGLVAR